MASELSALHIPALDEALQQRANEYYQQALLEAVTERITALDQDASDFGEQLSGSFQAALQELAGAVKALNVDFVPIQGTLISLLRYGAFPAGRLSDGKWDVVDNDAEILIVLDHEDDLDIVGPSISLALEARGWPPCINPHFRKFVCFSLRHAIPCKMEIYAATKDVNLHAVFFSRSCTAVGMCKYSRGFPFQYWDGRMPIDIIYPLGRCRIGSGLQDIFCPNMPLELLRGWNMGEYSNQSVVAFSKDLHRSQMWRGRLDFSKACLALPVLSKDRDRGDSRNQRLQRDGLSVEDLRLLKGYARALQRQGFASLYAHLQGAPCSKRQRRISKGDPHAGLSQLGAA